MSSLEQTLAAARQALTDSESALEDTAESITELEQSVSKLRKEEETADEPLRTADTALRSLKAEISGLERLLRKSEKSTAPPVMDALSPQPGFERALAAALGDDLNAPTDPSAPAYWGGASTGTDPSLPAGVTPFATCTPCAAYAGGRLRL